MLHLIFPVCVTVDIKASILEQKKREKYSPAKSAFKFCSLKTFFLNFDSRYPCFVTIDASEKISGIFSSSVRGTYNQNGK